MMRVVQSSQLIVMLNPDLTYRHGRPSARGRTESVMAGTLRGPLGGRYARRREQRLPRRNLARSGRPSHTEQLRLTERYRRPSFGTLEIEATFSDPGAYTRPWTVKVSAEYAPDTEMLEWVCNEGANRSLVHWIGQASDDLKNEKNVAPETLARYVGTYIEQPPFWKSVQVSGAAQATGQYCSDHAGGRQAGGQHGGARQTRAHRDVRGRVHGCAIDMGSNRFRRIVASFENGRYQQRLIETRTLGVGDDVARHGRISDPKLAEIKAVLGAFKTSCEKQHAAPVVAIGTSAFREAPNGARAVDIAAKLGIAMEIATEQRESELAYLVGSLGQDGCAVIDNGSRSIELVSKEGGAPHYRVFNLGYRLAYETFFAAAGEPETAVRAFRDRLRQEALKAPFMKGKKKLIGVEFGEMADVLFAPATLEGRVFTLQALKQRLHEITTSRANEFLMLKKKKDIDRALPRLVVAAVLTEELGYSLLKLTERELGSGLIIEAGLKKR